MDTFIRLLTDGVLHIFGQLSDGMKVLVLLLLIVALVGALLWKLRDYVQTRDLKKELRRMQEERDELQQRLNRINTAEGNVWTHPDDLKQNQFVNRSKRKTRFISICNLKGGVGKTTMSINLGTCLALRGKKTLLVDLDFQASLSNYLLTEDQLDQNRKKGWTTKKLLETNSPQDVLSQCIFKTKDIPNCSGIISWDDLEDTEYLLHSKFFVNTTQGPEHRDLEIRFLIQRLLHQDQVFHEFDYVLFDCPPRLTTACVNGLTCSDYLLLPTSLADGDIEAIARTLEWLKRLHGIVRADIVGVAISRCGMRGGKLTKGQEGQLASLENRIRRQQPGDHLLSAKIPDKAEIHRAKRSHRPIVLDSVGCRKSFNDLCDELLQRMPS